MKLHQIKKTLLPLLLLLCLVGCSKDNEPKAYSPTLVTNSAADLTRFQATLSGLVVENENSMAKAEVFFLFAKGAALVDAEEFVAVPDKATEGRYTCTIEGLLPGNDYCYAICARSGGSVSKGEVTPFQTLSSTVPVPAAATATNVNESGALLSSDITDNGGVNITQRGFVYKVFQEGMPEPTTSDKIRTVSMDAEEFKIQLGDLLANTKYIVRAYAINKTGTGYGTSVTFVTEDLKTPQLLVATSSVTAFTVGASATVSTNGGFKLKEYGFCWSIENQVPTVDNLKSKVGSTDVKEFQQNIANLDPETSYYLRAYAINEKGIGYSNVVTFKTEKKQVVTLPKPTAGSIAISSALISCTIQVPTGVEVTEKGICYSLFSTKPATDGSHLADTGQGNNISLTLKNLNEGATYYATAYAVTRDGTFYSEAVQFTLNRTYEPTVGLTEVGTITETGATVKAKVSSDGGRAVTERGVCWSKDSSTPTIEDSKLASTASTNDFSVKLTGLEKGMKYYVRAYAKNVNGVGYSPAMDFTTALTKAPEVVNLQTPTINDDNVKVEASISDTGGLPISKKGFVYSESVISPTIGAVGVINVESSSTGNVFTAQLTKLAYTKRYYIAAYAINAKGTSYSSPTTFVTSSSTTPSPSAIVTDTTVTATTAVLEGRISSDGGATVTEVGFCWSDKTWEPTLEDSHLKATIKDNSFTITATGLKAYTYYYVRAYAKNKNGVGYSYNISFRTLRTTPGGGDNEPPGM